MGVDKRRVALERLLHFYAGAKERWEERRQKGLHDAALREAVNHEFPHEGGSSGPGLMDVCGKNPGGRCPQLWYDTCVPKGKPALQGRDLYKMAREVLNIPYPAVVSWEEVDAALSRVLGENRWIDLRKTGASDATLASEIGLVFKVVIAEGGPGLPWSHTEVRGETIKFWCTWNIADWKYQKPTLQGKALVARVRRVLGITQPAPAGQTRLF